MAEPTSPLLAIPDADDQADMPLTMAASVVLTSLPRDAHQALENAGDFEVEKGSWKLRFRVRLCYTPFHII
jgi:ubiquitin-like protein ATG12